MSEEINNNKYNNIIVNGNWVGMSFKDFKVVFVHLEPKTLI